MPLKLKDVQHPSSTSLINKWADEKEATLDQHKQIIRQLQQKLTELESKLK